MVVAELAALLDLLEGRDFLGLLLVDAVLATLCCVCSFGKNELE